MGLGGDVTVLQCHIEHADTHMTLNPVAVNYQCWAARRASAHIAADGTVDFDREADVAPSSGSAAVDEMFTELDEFLSDPAARRIGSEGGGRLPHPGWGDARAASQSARRPDGPV